MALPVLVSSHLWQMPHQRCIVWCIFLGGVCYTRQTILGRKVWHKSLRCGLASSSLHVPKFSLQTKLMNIFPLAATLCPCKAPTFLIQLYLHQYTRNTSSSSQPSGRAQTGIYKWDQPCLNNVLSQTAKLPTTLESWAQSQNLMQSSFTCQTWIRSSRKNFLINKIVGPVRGT